MPSTISQPKATEKFAKSIGGSLKSLVGAGGRTYFVLEHKSSSDKHKAGQTSEFIGDYIELGRGNSYAVNYGEDCRTVSRPHAAIIRKNNGWILKPLSGTNPTFLNRQRIDQETPLTNGDEIQLSAGGPKVAFLTPANNSVKSMGMTIRMKAMMNEAIRPYKTTIISIVALFILAVAGLSFFLKRQNDTIDNQNTQIASLTEKLKSFQQGQDKLMDSIVKANAEKQKREPAAPNQPKSNQYVAVPPSQAANIHDMYPGVYYIKSSRITYTVGDETKTVNLGITATGFLLKDGRFVTARHVVEPWDFLEEDSTIVFLNIIANNGGKVVHEFTAESPQGGSFTFRNTDFTINSSTDASKTLPPTDEGLVLTIKNGSLNDGTDWAYANVNNASSGLDYDNQMCSELMASTELYILGYPFGDSKEGNPVYSQCYVSKDGLSNGIIGIAGRGFDTGNSGGPAFARKSDGSLAVVGIVSAERGAQGVLVPISAIH